MAYEPSRLPNGLSTATTGTAFENCIIPGPLTTQSYVNDFDVFTAGDWVVTETNSSATEAIANAALGQLVITNTAAVNDIAQIQKAQAFIVLNSAKPYWLQARFNASDATTQAVAVGLQSVNTDGSLSTNGVFFLKANGSTTLTAIQKLNNTATTVGTTTMADGTMVTVGLAYDPQKNVTSFYVNDVISSTLDSASSSLPTVVLAPTAVIKAGAAAAKTMNLDYIAFVQAR